MMPFVEKSKSESLIKTEKNSIITRYSTYINSLEWNQISLNVHGNNFSLENIFALYVFLICTTYIATNCHENRDYCVRTFKTKKLKI